MNENLIPYYGPMTQAGYVQQHRGGPLVPIRQARMEQASLAGITLSDAARSSKFLPYLYDRLNKLDAEAYATALVKDAIDSKDEGTMLDVAKAAAAFHETYPQAESDVNFRSNVITAGGSGLVIAALIALFLYWRSRP